MSCRVQDGAKVANDGSKRKPQAQFPSRRMSGHCDWRSSSGYLHWLSTSATPPGDGETGRDRSHGSHLETERLEETETMARHLERRSATETSIPDVRVPGGGILLPPGTAKRHRRSPSGDDRARWEAWKAMIRRLWPRPFTWNGGRQQKRPFPMSEFQVEAFCFHPERPNSTGSPPAATTVPSGKPVKQ